MASSGPLLPCAEEAAGEPFTILKARLSEVTCNEVPNGTLGFAPPTQISRPHHIRRTFGLLALVVIPKPVSNLFLTWGVRHFPHVLSIHPAQYALAVFDPLVLVGVAIQIFWLLGRMSLLSVADLSFVVPVTATGYVLSALLGRVFLHEHIDANRWLGILLITLGAVLVAPTIANFTFFPHNSHGSEQVDNAASVDRETGSEDSNNSSLVETL